ncbi:hypothetical protein D3C73_768820 [compost metagenome]
MFSAGKASRRERSSQREDLRRMSVQVLAAIDSYSGYKHLVKTGSDTVAPLLRRLIPYSADQVVYEVTCRLWTDILKRIVY